MITMKRTQMFTKTLREAPADEVAKNAILLIRAGFVSKQMAGTYAYFPLGKKVLDNIMQIIREEMNAIGGEEIQMTVLQNPAVWQKSGRWSDDVMDVWFKTKLQNGSEVGLAPTHEEPLTNSLVPFIQSYKDLPRYPYQFQTKFRNEVRAKSGLMRGREFLMKDLYSYSRSREEHETFYEKCAESYMRVFNRLGIGDITYKTFASGGSFSKFSHEFQTLSPVGEDTIYISKEKKIAVNKEVYTDEVLADLGLKRDELVEEKAVEVGNIFTLGTKYTEALGLNFTDEDGAKKPAYGGSYGIGPSRLMGFLAEHFPDDKGLVWPEDVAPAKVYLVNIGQDASVVKNTTDVYEQLLSKGIEVIWDDRDARPGEKFADADLMGIPYRVVISSKLGASKAELKHRISGEVEILTINELLKKLK
jgi:prolyl-tRNA synthetase